MTAVLFALTYSLELFMTMVTDVMVMLPPHPHFAADILTFVIASLGACPPCIVAADPLSSIGLLTVFLYSHVPQFLLTTLFSVSFYIQPIFSVFLLLYFALYISCVT